MKLQRQFKTDRSFGQVRDYVLEQLIPAVRNTSSSRLSRLLKPRVLRDEDGHFQVSALLEKRLFLRVGVYRTDPGTKIQVELVYRFGSLILVALIATIATMGVAALFAVPLFLWARRRFRRYAVVSEELLTKDLQAIPIQ